MLCFHFIVSKISYGIYEVLKNLEHNFLVFTQGYIYQFERERGRGRKKERERDIDQLPSTCTPTEDQPHNLSMCLDQESNQWSFSAIGWCSNQPSHTGQGLSIIFTYRKGDLEVYCVFSQVMLNLIILNFKNLVCL